MSEREIQVMILVKAAPVLTAALEETMCVAAMTLKEHPEWVRLHPVPFRDLGDEERFKKYQEVTMRVIPPRSDRRPESRTPVVGSIQPGVVVGTAHDWSERKARVQLLGEQTMCDLIAANSSGSGPKVPSFGVVRPLATPALEITPRDPKQIEEWTRRAEAAAAQPSLFDDPETAKTPLEVVPWRFRYKYRCSARGCKGHAQTIVDWEAVALWRRVRTQTDWKDRMERKFVTDMWRSERDTVIFVGNQAQHPTSFLVIGVFWPPAGPVQPTLEI